MPSQNPRLCIFGDSHMAAPKEALNQGLVDTSGIDIEFWGNIGRRFRFLTWKNERIEPLDTFTAHRFSKFNEKQRTVLAAEDFDMVLFSGCRLSLYKLFPELLHRRKAPQQWISAGVQRRIIADFLRGFPPYQFARNFAKQGKTAPVFAPISFETEGFGTTVPEKFSAANLANKKDRTAIWDVIDSVMAEDGVGLLRQDERTVVQGCRTKASYAVDNYIEKQDPTHKNAKYGALVLNATLSALRKQSLG